MKTSFPPASASSARRSRYVIPSWGQSYWLQEDYPGHWDYRAARERSAAQRRSDAARMQSALAALRDLERADTREKCNDLLPEEVMQLFEEWSPAAA